MKQGGSKDSRSPWSTNQDEKMPAMMRSLALLLCPFLSLSVAAQESAARWENMKTLALGTQIRVVSSASRKPIQGTLKSVTDSDLSLMRDNRVQSFSRAQIISVSAKQKGHRLRKALIGLGVGTAAGALIGYGIGHSGCPKSGGGWCGLEAGVDAGVGGVSGLAGGALIGAFWHTGKWTEVYVR
jgi:hypothetical protein